MSAHDQMAARHANLAALGLPDELMREGGTAPGLLEAVPLLQLPSGMLPLSPRHPHALLGQGSGASLFRSVSDALGLLSDAGHGLPAPLDLGWGGPHSQPYGLLGLQPGLELPLPGIGLEQPLASFLVGRAEPRADQGGHPTLLTPMDWLHQPRGQAVPSLDGSPGQLVPLPLLVQQHDRQLLLHTTAGGQAAAAQQAHDPGSSRGQPAAAGSDRTAWAAPAGRCAASPASAEPQPAESVGAHSAGPSSSGQETEEAEEEEASMADEETEEESSEDERPKRAKCRAAPKATKAPKAAKPATSRRRRGAGTSAAAVPAAKAAGRSSQYRGVTKHRRSGRYEAHIWVKDLGRQMYLGGYEREEHAAEAYDIAALKCKGCRVKTNFDAAKYADLQACIGRMSMEELVMAVRRQSQGFSRGTSSFRGVTRHPGGRWESRIGVPGSRHIYLGLYSEEEEAARAYDRALVRLRGRGAATNYALGEYRAEMGDYHAIEAAKLRADGRMGEILTSHDLLERLLKNGCKAFPELDAQGGAASGAEAGQAAPKPEQAEQQQQS